VIFQKAVLKENAAVAALVEITERMAACRDPKDQKFLELAVNRYADVLITGDGDLLAQALHARRQRAPSGMKKRRSSGSKSTLVEERRGSCRLSPDRSTRYSERLVHRLKGGGRWRSIPSRSRAWSSCAKLPTNWGLR
jgi:hypothetical protein